MAEESVLKGLCDALGFSSLSQFSGEWRTLNDQEKEQLKADYRLYRAANPA